MTSVTPGGLRVALVGCGQIADAHLQELRRVAMASVVAVCDIHLDLAQQAATRFGIPAAFDSLPRMLDQVRPDVVHITTPPHTHHDLALKCLARGSHLYVEKPFSIDEREAKSIVAAAEARCLRVCLGHDQLFDPAWQEFRRRHAAGEIGDVVHVEVIQGYDLDGPFGRLLQDDATHWVHRLPGGLFQNVISHALARILDLMSDPDPYVYAEAFGWHGGAFPTELRVLLRGGTCTGSLTFSTTVRPTSRVTRVYGTRGALDVDLDARTVTANRAASLPGALAKVEIAWRRFATSARHLASNLSRLRRYDLHYFEGMRALFDAFYAALIIGGDSPIAHDDALRTTRIMDVIFAKCRSAADEARHLQLVTGSMS